MFTITNSLFDTIACLGACSILHLNSLLPLLDGVTFTAISLGANSEIVRIEDTNLAGQALLSNIVIDHHQAEIGALG